MEREKTKASKLFLLIIHWIKSRDTSIQKISYSEHFSPLLIDIFFNKPKSNTPCSNKVRATTWARPPINNHIVIQ